MPTNKFTFADWDVKNTEYLFPINERFLEKNAQGADVMVVENTISHHAFEMIGDTNTNKRPEISQTVNITASTTEAKPYTLKFLMKGISNLQVPGTVVNGIHLDIWEAGNEEDISVDIPYTGQKGEWQLIKYTIYTKMPQIKITIKNISTILVDENNIPTNGVIYLSDLMFTSGTDTPPWTVSPGEIYNNYVTIGSEGVVVTSNKDATGAMVRTIMDSHSFRVETIDSNKQVNTNILVDGDSTSLGPTHIKGQCDIGKLHRLRFIENLDLGTPVEDRNPGIDIILIKG